jgi:hypothetical protein
MTQNEFNDKSIWTDSDRNTHIRSNVLLLEKRLEGENYLYLEGIVRLAAAMMIGSSAIPTYYRLITGSKIDHNMMNLFVEDPVAFAVKAVLKFRPPGIKDPGEIERYKMLVENAVMAAA